MKVPYMVNFSYEKYPCFAFTSKMSVTTLRRKFLFDGSMSIKQRLIFDSRTWKFGFLGYLNVVGFYGTLPVILEKYFSKLAFNYGELALINIPNNFEYNCHLHVHDPYALFEVLNNSGQNGFYKGLSRTLLLTSTPTAKLPMLKYTIAKCSRENKG